MKSRDSEWRREVWNPITGCTKISAGCRNCTAERIAKTLRKNGVRKFRRGFGLMLHPLLLDQPRSWRLRRLVYVGTMTDIFHRRVPREFIQGMFRVMNETPQHSYMITTKRPERIARIADKLEWSPNIWLGVTIESADVSSRADILRKIPARIRYIYFEPLIGEIADIDLGGIDWALIGGETGRKSRPMKPEWVAAIRRTAHDQAVPLFFSQWGSGNSGKEKSRLAKLKKIDINQLKFDF
ncbi:MAG: DUF5131 family protein [Candidatus Kapaibacterium sp.]